MEAALLDVPHGEQGVIQAAEAVVHDDDDRQSKLGGEVGHGFFANERDFPAACSFDEDVAVPCGEAVLAACFDIDAAVFQQGGGVG